MHRYENGVKVGQFVSVTGKWEASALGGRGSFLIWVLEDEEILIALTIRRLTNTELHELNTVFSGDCKWTEGHG